MRAIWVTRHGGLDALEVRESADPEPQAGEVRVVTRAVGLNFAEVMARRGTYPDAPRPPCILGYEGAGVIDRVGPGVDPRRVGERVIYMSRFGGQASHVCVDEAYLASMPPEMSFEDAAALPVNYVTAYHMLHQVWRLRSGDRVLVHMAAGGVGTAVLQLCHNVPDVVTFGTAPADRFDFVRSHGCMHPIDYRTEDYAEVVRRSTGGEGIDLVLDPLGGIEQWSKGYSLLRPAGLLIVFGLAQVVAGGRREIISLLRQMKKEPPFTALTFLDDNRGVAGVNIGHLWSHTELIRRHGLELIRLYSAGRIRPHIGRRFPFSQIAAAHEELETGKSSGKIVLLPD